MTNSITYDVIHQGNWIHHRRVLQSQAKQGIAYHLEAWNYLKLRQKSENQEEHNLQDNIPHYKTDKEMVKHIVSGILEKLLCYGTEKFITGIKYPERKVQKRNTPPGTRNTQTDNKVTQSAHTYSKIHTKTKN